MGCKIKKVCRTCGIEKDLNLFPKASDKHIHFSELTSRLLDCKICYYAKAKTYPSYTAKIREVFNPGEKRCVKCKKIKAYSEFWKVPRIPKRNPNSISVVNSRCIDCRHTREKFEPGYKRCKDCKCIKPIRLFYLCKSGRFGVDARCKNCTKIKGFEYRARPEVRAKTKAYNQSDKAKQSHRKSTAKRKHTAKFRIRNALSSKIRRAVTDQWMSPKTEKYIGCTMHEFLKHIESQFTKGMSFDNYGVWHLDHILPISRFNMKDDLEIKTCFHYTNYQPLWAKKNMNKKANIIKGTEQIKLPI